MKKVILLFVLLNFILFSLSSCGNSYNKLVGNWVNEDNENKLVKIYKDEEDFIIEQFDNKYIAEKKDNNLVITDSSSQVVFKIKKDKLYVYSGTNNSICIGVYVESH